MAQAEAPALILMDVSLPGIDGLEATRRLKAAAADPPHSDRGTNRSHHGQRTRDKALAVGCDDFDTQADRSYRGCWRRLRPLLGQGPSSVTTDSHDV